MERIQEAIEKAKKERQGKIGAGEAAENASPDLLDDTLLEPQSEAAAAESVAREPSERKEKTGQTRSSIQISYSKTRKLIFTEEELKDKFIIGGFAHDRRAEPYRQLRSQILKLFRSNKWQTLAITSPNLDGGSTLTAINLAISLSLEANQTVLLVDLNLRNPGIASAMGLVEIDRGIVDYLHNDINLEDILINPGYDRLVILPGTSKASYSSEILSSPEMAALKEEMVNRYPSRIIIFDLPAVLDNDDALVFAPECDATLLVVEEGGTKKQDLERAQELLKDANVIGSVLNKVRYN